MAYRIFLVSLVSFLLLQSGGAARAQVPPHAPGTICFTPSFWCWASQPGAPGRPCTCRDRNDNIVEGTLG